MSDSRFAVLLRILRGAEARDPRWPAIEGELGLQLPGSYKALVEQFGASVWQDFLRVLSPFDEQRELRRVGGATLEADRALRREFPWYYPLPLYPEPGGLLPWAVSDNGDVLYFITAGLPDQWPTVIKGARAPEFEVCFLPPALLVYHFAAGSLRSTILPRSERA